ncbi:hypothetical protein LCGC14_1292460 [marine sediment metagenome]|uniref:Uncharacterized protein n=1 Tax=marine sediment metagenome TaxID=412755 RepID=A0A0F9N8H8_9ZZZZ
MAGLKATAQTAEITTGTALKTILQLVAAANHRVVVKEISISFKGTLNTAAPILVQVARQTDAGTMSALTPKKMNESDQETLQTTAQDTATVEPTLTDDVISEEVHPQGGYTWQAPFGGEIIIEGGNRLAILTTAIAAVNCVARIVFEE